MISHLNFVPAGAGARSDVARVVDGVRGAVMHVGRARVVQDEDAEAHAAVLLLGEINLGPQAMAATLVVHSRKVFFWRASNG